MTFENTSPTPGLEWLSEAFPATFREQLNSPILYVASREERLRAYDRVGVPGGVHPARATLYRIAEQMDVDYAILGSYGYDGVQLTATAQLLDMRAPRLLPAVRESGPLAQLVAVQSALAWDLLHQMHSDFSLAMDKYIAGIAPLRLDAFESYIRGLLAASAEERIEHYKEAARLDPAYSEAWLALGKTYFAQRAYALAVTALTQAASAPAVDREANFYLGLAAYYQGDLARAKSAFEFVAARLPLAEVYNNLGVVNAHRSLADAAISFRKAIDNDPSDPDYHFNLGLALSRAGDNAGAARELRAALERRPGDTDAQALLDSLTPPVVGVVPKPAPAKPPVERLKRNYEENSFRQMTMQMQSWAEQQYARSNPRSHALFHIELGKELLAHGFTAEAEREFREASTLDSGSTAALNGLAEVFEARGDAREARAQAEASLRTHESADAYLLLTRLDLSENRIEAATQDIDRALHLESANAAAQDLKRAVAAKLAEKAQPLPQP